MKDLSQIKLLVCDCDGVLTDGLIIYDSAGAEAKHFSAHDGMGFHILRHSEIQAAVITGRKSVALQRRCDDLQIKYCFQEVKNKKAALADLLNKLNLKWENVAYVGDDWNDFPAMEQCLLKIAPKNATENFKMVVDYVTEHPGGYGAVRDAIEYILKARNEFSRVLESFLAEWGSCAN